MTARPAETSLGVQRRDFLHLDDVAWALVALLDCSVTGPVNIGSGADRPLADLIHCVAEEIGRPDLLRMGAVPDRPGEPPLLVADVTRLRDEVGFVPANDLRTEIADTVAWWRQTLEEAS